MYRLLLYSKAECRIPLDQIKPEAKNLPVCKKYDQVFWDPCQSNHQETGAFLEFRLSRLIREKEDAGTPLMMMTRETDSSSL